MGSDLPELARAVDALRAGGLVAMPTETVYGLAARALDPRAVRRVFAAKGRPADHPVIVHAADADGAFALAREVPEEARALAAALWPGPLTLVLRRAACVPDEVTGGQDTVGLRVPAHPVALALLRALGEPLAAPSANRFGHVSPTTAAHVRRDLGDAVEVVLEGGATEVGVESTIVDLSGGEPVILRPGGVPRERLEAVLGRPVPMAGKARAEHGAGGGDRGDEAAREADTRDRAADGRGREAPVRAPGTLAQHYAPRARVALVPAEAVASEARRLRAEGLRVAVLPVASDDASVTALARDLYALLRAADDDGAEVIVAATPAERGLGAAVADRLRRAAAGRP
jgi:L-threonylcarbamoyladenylate synthase